MMTILEYNAETDYVVFADTGREHPKTYKFLNDFEAFEGIPIHRIQYQNEHGSGFTALYKKKKTIPNRQFRTCTVELKIKQANRFARTELGLKKMDWLIGFRADEQNRVLNYDAEKYKTPVFPLYERGVKLQNVFDFWAKKSFTLEIPRIMGNCDLCFLKGKNNIIKIMTHYPELSDKWIADEKRNGKTFFKDVSYTTLLQVAKSQTQLFELETLEEVYQCACTQY